MRSWPPLKQSEPNISRPRFGRISRRIAPRASETGATAVEYALMVGLVGIAIITSVTTLRGKVSTTLNRAGGAMTICEPGQFKAEYFNVYQDVSGSPVLTRCVTTFGENWVLGSPSPEVYADMFSARWTGSLDLAAGTRTFSVYSDNGVRLKMDGVTILDNWTLHVPVTDVVTKTVTAGSHDFVLEFYEQNGGAAATVTVS